MGNRYIVYKKNKITVEELKNKSPDVLEEMKQDKFKDYLCQQQKFKNFTLNPDPFTPDTQEYKEQFETLKNKVRFLMLDVSTINQIIKEKRRNEHEKENKLCYRFYQVAKSTLDGRVFSDLEEKAKEEMILKGEL